MTSTCRFPRLAVCGLLVLGSSFAKVPVARADVQLGASSLRASARARVDPNATEKVDMVENVPAPGAVHAIFVQATTSDSALISESVNTTGSVEVTDPSTFSVLLSASRSGTDDTLDNPGGTYSARTTFELSFIALADGSVTVGETFVFKRPNTGTFTPFGVTLESGADRDARSPQVPFGDKAGTGGSPEAFTLHAGRGYLLRIEVAMAGGTSDTAEEESWDGGFSVQLPPIAPSATSTTTTTITATTSTTTTTLARLCPISTPAACAPGGLPRSITRKLQQGCTLADRAGSASEKRAAKFRKRSEAKLLAACHATSKAAAKGKKVSAACGAAVLGVLGAHCGG